MCVCVFLHRHFDTLAMPTKHNVCQSLVFRNSRKFVGRLGFPWICMNQVFFDSPWFEYRAEKKIYPDLDCTARGYRRVDISWCDYDNGQVFFFSFVTLCLSVLFKFFYFGRGRRTVFGFRAWILWGKTKPTFLLLLPFSSFPKSKMYYGLSLVLFFFLFFFKSACGL